MFRVHFTNFDYSREFKTLGEAVEAARKAFFEASITANGVLVATFSPFNGLTQYRGADR
jgi:hypothetical protein